MNTLFLVQFACCIIVSMLGLILVLSRFQIRWTNRRYEVSRRLLAFSMFVLAWHYVLQMVCGFRAKGDEIGAVVNVLFYSPVSFFISYATYNLICYRGGRKKFALLGCVSYALILICFFFGYNDTPRGMHMGEWLYVMLALFAVTIMYSTYTTVIEMRYHRKIIEENTTEDLLPFDRYTYTTYGLAGIMVLAMVGAICYRPLLYCVGPLMLFSLISFTISFLGYGYNMIPAEVRLELDTADEPLEVMEESEEVGLGSEKISIIESMLTSWCDKGGYRDSTVNMPMLSVKLGIPRNELSMYFENCLKSSFRIWLSDIRFKEAQRMLLEECRYSNDTISSECGFSSHAHLYKIFKAKTGFTPGQWKKQGAYETPRNDGWSSESET
jgi:AraC-like DNA-binding protein